MSRERGCRNTRCTGNCSWCKRRRAKRREYENPNETVGEFALRKLAERGLLEEVEREAAAIVATAVCELSHHGERIPPVIWETLDETGIDTQSSAAVQTYIDTGLFPHRSELVEWF